MKRHTWTLLAVVCLLGADAAQDDAAKKENEKFQGTWYATSFETAMGKLPEEQAKNYKFVLTGDKYAENQDGMVTEEGTFKLDPTQKPKQFTLDIKTGQNKDLIQMCIYEFDGETLKICFGANGGKVRPKEFAAKADPEQWVVVFKKEKAK